MISSFELNGGMYNAVTIMILMYSSGMCASDPCVHHKVMYTGGVQAARRRRNFFLINSGVFVPETCFC